MKTFIELRMKYTYWYLLKFEHSSLIAGAGAVKPLETSQSHFCQLRHFILYKLFIEYVEYNYIRKDIPVLIFYN